MKKLTELLKEHKIAFILAVLTSVLCALPQAYFRIDHTELYQDNVEDIEMLVSSNWSPRVREVMDGHPNWGSIYFKDGKEGPYLFQPLGSIVVAYTGELFGFGINNTILLSRIIFPFLTFILMYAFVFLLSRNKLAALASTSAILLVDFLVSPSGIKAILTGEVVNRIHSVNFLEISHPVNSSMIFVFFFGFLVTFFLFYQKWKWQWGVVSTLLLGLNFYNYFYSWTFLFSFGGVLCFVLALQKKWKEVFRVVYVFVGALVVAIPYIWNLYSATQHTTYVELSLRHGVLVSHAPLFIGATTLCALVVFLFGFPRADKQKYVFGLSLLLATMVVLNQQIITGKVLQVGHYHWYIHKPLAVIFVVMTLFSLLDRWSVPRHYKRLLAVSMILISFAIGTKIQALSYMDDGVGKGGDGIGMTLERQKYAPIMDWLNAHAEKESVVFANELTSNIVVIYTPLNVFHHHADHLTLPATDERLQDLIFTYYRLRGVGEENVEEVFQSEKLFIATRLTGIHSREKDGNDGSIPDEVFDGVVLNYRHTLSTPTSEWLYDIWKKYEVEYLVWDKNVDPTWRLEQYSFLKEEATFGDIAIYSFSRENSSI